VDQNTGKPADNKTPAGQEQQVTALDLPAQAAAWGRKHGLILWDDLIQGKSIDVANPSSTSGIWITNPGTGSVYVLTPQKPLQDQQIRIEVGVKGVQNQVALFVDGKKIASLTEAPYQAWWTLSPGKHQIWAQSAGADKNVITSPVIEINVQSE
jgi:hypothetical protein